jgi:protein tyrosine/serine phosphatase
MKKWNLNVPIIGLLVITGIVLLVNHFVIKYFCEVKPEVLYTSAQPRGMDYTRLLYKYHIAMIVNVRSAFEHRDRNWHNEEITWVRNNGVKYVELPIDKGNPFPDKQTQQKFLEIMADKANQPILLHGSGNDKRVAMLAAVWLKKDQGLTAEEIFDAVKKINSGQELDEAQRKFIKEL